MLNQLTYRQKNYLLIAGVFIAIWISYSMAIKNTLVMKSEYEGLKRKQTEASSLPERLQQLTQQNKSLSRYINLTGSSTENNQTKVVDVLSNFCQDNNLKLSNVSDPHFSETEDFAIETFTFTCSGGFKNLLALTYHLEQEAVVGKVASMQFEKKKDYRTRKERLEGTYYIQNISEK